MRSATNDTGTSHSDGESGLPNESSLMQPVGQLNRQLHLCEKRKGIEHGNPTLGIREILLWARVWQIQKDATSQSSKLRSMMRATRLPLVRVNISKMWMSVCDNCTTDMACEASPYDTWTSHQ